ncbi:carbohydrate ABC transporter permease [Pedococcus bigeumensis]|uniref:Carbohydrate ABC transporter permease n=1 Tax=Pedococcus bigeumensis TaxID=433644 RepID=A0A502D2P0_9MICO|nr:carbohydrate ABC transporter permease [Pedococcus bigeumensis]TPG18356.1 carbohydrate ABC transporter permease [Pedococcus bigeumensis]
MTQTQIPAVVPPVAAPSKPPSARHTRSLARLAAQSTGATPAGKLIYLCLAISVLLAAGPLYYMVVMASRPNSDITSTPPPLTPGNQLGANITRVFDNQDVMFGQAMVNSVLVAGVATVSVVVLSALAGFAFAKLRFRGRNALLLIVIGTMMVPVQLGLVPLYMLMGKLGLAGTLPSALLPFLVSGFGVFMMRQYAAQAIPNELIEAARVDGASTFRIFFSVVFPILRPAAAVLGLLTFMERWNDFLWPYLTLDAEHPTVQVALSRLSGGYYTDQALVMAGTLLGTLPLVIVFIVFGRQIIGGIMQGGVKG